MKKSQAMQSSARKSQFRNDQEEQAKLFVDDANVAQTIINDDEIVEKKKKRRCCECNFTPYILMLALSIHAIFEGLALGLEQDLTTAIDLMIAILIHKGVAGLSLAISL